jgi:Holliday junction resolvase
VKASPIQQDGRRSDPTLTFKQSERSFQNAVVRYARLMGWAVVFTHDSRHSPKGWPDLVCIRRPRIVFLELKAQRGRVTPEQAACLAELRACGMEALVARPSQWQRLEELFR